MRGGGNARGSAAKDNLQAAAGSGGEPPDMAAVYAEITARVVPTIRT